MPATLAQPSTNGFAGSIAAGFPLSRETLRERIVSFALLPFRVGLLVKFERHRRVHGQQAGFVHRGRSNDRKNFSGWEQRTFDWPALYRTYHSSTPWADVHGLREETRGEIRQVHRDPSLSRISHSFSSVDVFSSLLFDDGRKALNRLMPGNLGPEWSSSSGTSDQTRTYFTVLPTIVIIA